MGIKKRIVKTTVELEVFQEEEYFEMEMSDIQEAYHREICEKRRGTMFYDGKLPQNILISEGSYRNLRRSFVCSYMYRGLEGGFSYRGSLIIFSPQLSEKDIKFVW